MKALVMDGGEAVRSMVGYMLRAEGFAVKEAAGAQGARDHLDSGFVPDVLISCGQAGVCSLKSLKTHTGMKRVPVLLMIEKDELKGQMEWKDAGVTFWLTWPIAPEKLIEAVRMVMFDEAR